MVQREKLLEKIRNNPNDVNPDDLKRLVVKFGFNWHERTNHSAISHEKIDDIFPIPRHKPINRVYIKKVIGLIDIIIEGEN